MEQRDINLLDYFWILVRWKRLIVLTVIIVTLGGFFFSYSKTPQYSATAVLLMTQNQADPTGLSKGMDQMGMGDPAIGIWDSAQFLGTFEAALKSRTIAERIIAKWNLIEFFFGGDKNNPGNIELAVRKLRSKVHIKKDKGRKSLTVKVVLTDPELAAAIANEYVIQLAEMVNKKFSRRVERQQKLIEGKLERNRKDLLESEKSLAGFFGSENIHAPRHEYLEQLELQRDLLKEFAAILTHQYEKVKIDGAREISATHFIDWARVPEIPSRPNRKLYALSFFLGGIPAALFIAYLAEFITIYWFAGKRQRQTVQRSIRVIS